MNSIKQMIFSGWHLARIIRLAFGMIMSINAIATHDPLSGIIGALFLFQAVTNTGCCGTSCAAPLRSQKEADEKEIVFEEVKSE
ncbi:MAG: hypothetical protein JST47_02000 [Bacteroidetes bacterium]|nr:hypothetical protein [Bacteroidota bacterium]MBS1972757.1 hypothetical protein [Bacteroidota bacterium]